MIYINFLNKLLLKIIKTYVCKMSEIIIFEDFNIILSLNDDKIYLKVTNNVTFEQYEGNITMHRDLSAIGDKIPLNTAFKMIKKAFNKKDGHIVLIKIYSDYVNVSFDINVEYINFKFDFNLRKKENVLTSDDNVSNPAILALNKKIEELEKKKR